MNLTNEQVDELEIKCNNISEQINKICKSLPRGSEPNYIWAILRHAMDEIKKARDNLYILRPVQ